jgi:hypothetical protein
MEHASAYPKAGESSEAYSVLGVLLSQKGQTNATIKALRGAEASKPDDLKVVTLVEGKYYSAGAETLERAVKQWPDTPDRAFC